MVDLEGPFPGWSEVEEMPDSRLFSYTGHPMDATAFNRVALTDAAQDRDAHARRYPEVINGVQ
jgi:hypothetical protein